jgi:hypothetical protein
MKYLSALLLVFGAACSSSSGGGSSSQAASKLAPDVAIAWFDQLVDNIRVAGFSPPVASRAIGYSGVAAYECVVPGMPDHRSLGGQLNGLDELPELPSGQHDWPTVLNACLAELQRNLFATAPQAVLDAIDALERDVTVRLAGLSEAVVDRSVARGQTIAMAIWDWSLTDGFDRWNDCAYTPPTGEGQWVPTPPAFGAALQPCWGRMRPFALLFGAECSVLAPPAYSTTPGSRFHQEAVEVYDTVNNLTQEQIDIAQFWADNPRQTGTPPGHWLRIVAQVAEQHDLMLDVAIEAYARVGIAVADAFICCWEMKYTYGYLRPITYIHDAAGLNDPAWNTAPGIGGGNIATPPFPEYTSGHSTQSGAAAFVLTDLLGNVEFVDDTHADLGLASRRFSSFAEAAQEAAISRLYGGIHYRAAIERGVDQGVCVGDVILDAVSFRE